MLLVPKTSTHIRERKRTEEKKIKKKEFIHPQHLCEGRGFVTDSVCIEICTSMKDFKCRGAENGSKIATKAAYAFGFIHFIKLDI